MIQSITVRLPEETLERFRHGAGAARKPLEEFLVDRLVETVPPAVEDLSSALRDELRSLERLDDRTLRRLAQSRLPAERQRRYSRLLAKNARGTLTAGEQSQLKVLGDEARSLTLKKAHAYLVLKWRGHAIPSRENFETSE